MIHPATAADTMVAAAAYLMCLNMYTESKIYVEYIETEISAGSHPRTVRLAVGALRLFVNLQAEHTERQVEAHVLHYEYAHAGAEIQTHFSDVRTGVARKPL